MDMDSLKMAQSTVSTPTQPQIQPRRVVRTGTNQKNINNMDTDISSSVETELSFAAKNMVSSEETSKEAGKEDPAKKELQTAIDNANKALQPSGRELSFAVHEKTHKVMVKVINSQTKEVIREIPPENVLDAYAKMLELAGILCDEKS